MRSAFILASLFTASTLAMPWGPGGWFGKSDRGRPPFNSCLTDDDATEGAEIFRQLIQNYTNTLALEALTEDFVDYSSAVNLIRNRGNQGPFVVNEATFTGRQNFMNAQGSQPPIPFDTLNVFHGCNHIAMRWQTLRSANGQKTEKSRIPVVGNAIIETVIDPSNKYGFRIKTLFSEFNAGAWMLNLGSVVSTMPNNTTLPANATDAPRVNARDLSVESIGMI